MQKGPRKIPINLLLINEHNPISTYLPHFTPKFPPYFGGEAIFLEDKFYQHTLKLSPHPGSRGAGGNQEKSGKKCVAEAFKP